VLTLREGHYGVLEREVLLALDVLDGVGPGPTALGRMRASKESWQVLLETLSRTALAVSGGEKRPEEAEESRIAWTLTEVRNGVVDLEARLQKRGPRGWGRGQAVARSRLPGLAQGTELSDADRRVVVHLSRERDSFGYGSRSYFVWKRDVALALVGHPHVFAADGETPLEVVEEVPELTVQRTDEGLRLTMRPEGLKEAGVFCRIEDGRLLVYRATAAHAEVARALGGRQVIPERAEAELASAIAPLGKVLRVSSDVSMGDANVDAEPADGRLRVVLRRATPGLRLRVGVRPFGEGLLLSPGVGQRTLVSEVGGARRVVERDLEAEGRAQRALSEACPSFGVCEAAGPELELKGLIECYELLTELQACGDGVVLEWPQGEPLTVVGERDVRDVRISVSSVDDLLRATCELRVDEERVMNMRELLPLLAKAQGRFVELDGGRVLALTERVKSKLERLERLASGFKGDSLEVHPLAVPAVAEWLADFELAAPPASVEQRMKVLREAQTLKVRRPRALRAELRDYQTSGYEWMRRLLHWGGGPLLCDDMGLGKTVQILAVLVELSRGGPSLVVAPTSVCGHWEEQARKFAPSLSVVRFGEGDRDEQLAQLGAGDVLLVSYGLLQRERQRLAEVEFHTAVLDEAQSIKNATSQRARAAHALRARHRIVSTGTPVENHLGELWSLFQFANPGLLGSAKRFEERFVRPIAAGDKRASEALKQLVRPFLLRRTKAEVIDELPEKTEITLTVEPSADEAAFYEALRRDAVESIDSDASKNQGARRMKLLTALTRLRQAACHPRLAGNEFLRASAKHETFFALLEELRSGGHRALVFSQFVEHLKLIREQLDERKVPYVYLDGATPAAERQKRVSAFQEGEGDLFLISLRAGGTGLNLTAADYVIHLDPWWNPAVESQATDRAHRIGQRRPVTVYRLVMAGTVEQRILALHGQKRATAEQLLDGAGTAAALELETLRGLLD
jgi:superfamily II DNA or RNA helicase